MTYLSFIDKFKILFDILLDYEFILVFIVLLLLFTFLYMIKKLDSKKYILYMMLSFVIIFVVSIASNYKILSNTFDNFATIFFGNIYFPSIYVYIGVLVISFVFFIVSILNVMLKRIYKIINSIMFVVNNIFFVIVLNIIAKNKIDIFSVNSLYSNTNLVVVLELSMGLFILWILSLITVYATNCICDRMVSKKVVKNDTEENVFNPVLEVTNDLVSDTTINNELATDIIEEPYVIGSISNCDNNLLIKETSVEEQNTTIDVEPQITFNDILNGGVPIYYYDNSDDRNYYEDKSVNIEKDNLSFNDVNIMLNKNEYDEISDLDSYVSKQSELSIEEKTMLEKEKLSEERISINTISLNDLVDNENSNVNEVEIETDNSINSLDTYVESKNNNIYTIDDYKKFIKMLTEVKNYSNGINVNIADAIAISLISNYSVDDCMMFKNILENNLN